MAVLIVCSAFGAITGVAVALFAGNLPTAGVSLLGALWGCMAFPMYSIAVAHATDYAEPTDFVVISSSLLLVYGIGAISGPFIASAVMTRFGPGALYLYTAAIHLMFLGYAVNRAFRRSAAPEEQHIPFGEAFAAANTASQIFEEEVENLIDVAEAGAEAR